MATPEEMKAAQDAEAAEAKAAQDAKEAEAKAAKVAKEKADLADLQAWVAKAMIASHQGDNPTPIEKIDPTSSMTAAREFVAAAKALSSYRRPKDDPKDQPADAAKGKVVAEPDQVWRDPAKPVPLPFPPPAAPQPPVAAGPVFGPPPVTTAHPVGGATFVPPPLGPPPQQ